MDTSKEYMFKNSNSGLYMEVANGSAQDNANIQQWGAGSSANHNTWTLKEFGGGYYYIISKLADGKTYYLNSTGKTDGSNIEILKNNKTNSHLFKFVKNPDGTYYILSRASMDEGAVEVAAASRESGANVQQWTVNGNSCQKWNIETYKVTQPAVTTVVTTSTTVTTKTTAKPVTTTKKTTAVSTEVSTAVITTSAVTDIVYGDINNDSVVDTKDITEIQRYLLNIEPLSEAKFKLADMNNDKIINCYDYIILKRVVSGNR